MVAGKIVFCFDYTYIHLRLDLQKRIQTVSMVQK